MSNLGGTVMSEDTDPFSVKDSEVTSRVGNLLWQGSMNVWQRGFAFDDFTSRVGVMDGWSFSRAVTSDNEILVIQQAEFARVQRLVGDTSTAACYLVGNLDHDATDVIAGKSIVIKTGIRSNATTGAISIRVQYTTYPDLQKIVAFDGVYPVEHNELVTQVITPTAGNTEFAIFDTIVKVPADAKQLAIVYIYNPSGTSPAEEWFEFSGVSITDRQYGTIPEVPFLEALDQAQRQYRKSYAYDSFPRTVSNFGALTSVSKGQDTLTDSVFPANFDVSMLYAPTVTVRTPSGGGVGVTFTNETKSAELTALVSTISSKGFRIESASKAVAYETGTFTPAFGSVTVTHTVQDGRFVKDGDTVHFEIEIQYNTLDLADVSDINITGLPFSGADKNGVGNVTLNLNASTGFALLATDTIHPIFLTTAGVTIVFTRSSGVNYDYNDGKMNASGTILLSGSYKTSEIYDINTYSTHYEAEARL